LIFEIFVFLFPAAKASGDHADAERMPKPDSGYIALLTILLVTSVVLIVTVVSSYQ
jgi:hypothetical protein